MVTELATGWAFGKVADLLWDGAKGTLQERLTKTDLERAMSAGLRAAAQWNQDQPVQQRLFFCCDTAQQDRFKDKAFADGAVQTELAKALTNEGQPEVAFLVVWFTRNASWRVIRTDFSLHNTSTRGNGQIEES